MAFTPNNSKQSDLQDLALLIHQAALGPHLNEESLNQICDTSRHFNFAGLCTHLNLLPAARHRLGAQSTTKLIAVIAFPFGAIPSSIKKSEVEWAAAKGADELEVVPNFFALSQRKTEVYAAELAMICETGLPVRVIIDINNLAPEKLTDAIEAAIDAGVEGIQNGNGFGPAVTTTNIQELVKIARGRCAIKAVGGIKTLDQTISLVEAGATSIGTSFGAELITALRKTGQ